MAAERYDHRFFEEFRSENIVYLAVSYARVCDNEYIRRILKSLFRELKFITDLPLCHVFSKDVLEP